MVKKRRKKLPRVLSSKISKDLLPYLVNKPTTNPSTIMEEAKTIELPARTYPESLNPFRTALSEIKLNEDENLKLNEFLERAITAKSVEELDEIVDQILDSGIRINAPNEEGYSFANIVIFKLCKRGNKQENIIKKLALNGADFDMSFIQNSKTIEICNKVEKEVEPHIYDRFKNLREVGENAAIEGTVENVEIDNKTLYIEFSQNSKVEVGKVIDGARELGLNKGNLGSNIVRLGDSELEIKTGKNGKRNYLDVSDKSAFGVTFLTSLGKLNVIIYHNTENYHQIQVEVRDENKEMWNELQKKGEIIGQDCLFGGVPVCEAIKRGGFIRSGRFCDQKFTETIKPISNFKSSESISWVDRVKDKETKPAVRRMGS